MFVLHENIIIIGVKCSINIIIMDNEFLTEVSAFPRNDVNSDTLNLKHDDEERYCLCKHINNIRIEAVYWQLFLN